MTSIVEKIFRGNVGGAIATAPMSVVMAAGFRQLPAEQRYPLPPRQITSVMGKEIGYWDRLTERQKLLVTLIAHFSYGSTMGGIFNLIIPPDERNVGAGATFGLGVWAGSYLALLPSLGILRPADEHPMERTILMILAHVVWGGSLAVALTMIDDAIGLEGENVNSQS